MSEVDLLPAKGPARHSAARHPRFDAHLRGADVALKATGLGEVEGHVSGVFARQNIRLEKSSDSLNFMHQWARSPHLSLHRVRYGAPLWKEIFGSLSAATVQMTLAGECVIYDGEQEITTRPGDLNIINSGRRFDKYWSQDAEQLMICIERGRGQRGSSQTDLSGVVFEPGPIQIDRHPLLAGLIASICADLDQDDPKISDPLVSLHLTEALVALLLRAVPHRKVDGEDRLSPAAPYYIVRCEKFLSQNLSRQFSLHELADEVGASARTLSSGFRRFRNTTPMGRLREIRLDRARALLSAGDGTETIGEIATRCGMSHLGRFAHYYAQRFNELPSETQLRVRRMKRFDSAVI